MLAKIDRTISKFEEMLSVILFLAMVLVVCWSVICRYLLKIPFLQGEELARFMMIYVVYIGTSIGVKSKTHIGVEVFVDMLPEKPHHYVKIFTEILSFALFALMFVLSIQMLMHLIKTNQMTTTTQVPTAIVFACIPMGLLMSVVHYLFNIYTLLTGKKMDGKEEQA